MLVSSSGAELLSGPLWLATGRLEVLVMHKVIHLLPALGKLLDHLIKILGQTETWFIFV